MKIYKIESIKHIIDIGIQLPHFWFRGQAKIFEELEPKIFRNEYFMGSNYMGISEYEHMEEYRRRAPALYDILPEQSDYLFWLTLMQHYGMPTRLLDWTENILVAAYFAVNDYEEKDGEIWCISPQGLNAKYNNNKTVLPTSDSSILYLSSEPFCKPREPKKLAHKLGLKNPPLKPLAFYPCLKFPRMVPQSSVFTIHPTPSDMNRTNSIDNIFKNKNEIVKYIIHRDTKEKIFYQLNCLGINKRTLFPELSSLAEDIISHEESEYQNNQKIPVCGGIWKEGKK